MPLKLGVNGFGRIGRMVVRAALCRDDVELVAINEPFMNAEYMVYQMRYDSAQGHYTRKVETDGKCLIVDDKKITLFHEKEPANIGWSKVGADIVAECTGKFTEKDAASAHIKGGAKRVCISAPSKSAPMFVIGVNHEKLTKEDTVFSTASCTTHCLAPIAKVLNDNFGIEEALMTTVHAVTISQPSVDGCSNKKDEWRMGRCAWNNIIPASTGAAKAVASVIPDLKGKITGMAFRVPVVCGSVVDLTARLKKDTTWDEVKKVMQQACDGPMKGVLGCSEEPLVSQDIIGDTRASIFDSQAGIMLNPRFLKVIAWYDNEFGYANCLVEMCLHAAHQDGLMK